MRLPAPFRTAPFRLTLMFVAAFALAAAAFLFYIYAVTAGEVAGRADREITAEIRSLETVYRQGGTSGKMEQPDLPGVTETRLRPSGACS